ncbi:MAG: DegT/DnrJ/EryC1/StrS family aminotransferase [Chlamydiia bacterium]|nr:DegT/DnrJ/EryC1/StrS family aminotransferase [Chlamydiia bacterium]
MLTKNFLPYAAHDVDESDCEAVMKVLHSSHLTRGETVQLFEQKLAEYCGAPYAVCFNSGTSALSAACFAAELSSLDTYITSVNTFIASVVPALQQKMTPLLCDVDTSTGLMDVETLDWEAINQKSRGQIISIPVHYAGIPCDVADLERHLASRHARIIEDAAPALGAWEDTACTRRVGCCSKSDLCVFSFHPAKTITTGEGGAVTTHSKDLYERLRLYRNNGISLIKDKEHQQVHSYASSFATGNFHLSDLQAALGLSQLERIDSMIKHKRLVAEWYSQGLQHTPHLQVLHRLLCPQTAPSLFVIKIRFSELSITKEQLMEALSKAGIGSQVHYLPLYRHPIVKLNASAFPQAESFHAEALSLPLTTKLKQQDVEFICHTLHTLIKGAQLKK